MWQSQKIHLFLDLLPIWRRSENCEFKLPSSLKEMLSAFSFNEMRTTLSCCPYFQKVICINIWKINVVRIFFWWNADNISSCPHVVRLSVVVRILSIPKKWHFIREEFFLIFKKHLEFSADVKTFFYQRLLECRFYPFLYFYFLDAMLA